MPGLEKAIVGLHKALEAPPRHRAWGWLVRHRIATVKEALSHEHAAVGDAWLAAREQSLTRERTRLQAELGRLGPLVLDGKDVAAVRVELRRLLTDLEHHRQRVNDLVNDSVSMDIGGSE